MHSTKIGLSKRALLSPVMLFGVAAGSLTALQSSEKAKAWHSAQYLTTESGRYVVVYGGEAVPDTEEVSMNCHGVESFPAEAWGVALKLLLKLCPVLHERTEYGLGSNRGPEQNADPSRALHAV